MRTPKYFALFTFFVEVSICCVGVRAQTEVVNYQAARQLQRKTRNKVFRQQVDPHWLPDNHDFWYRVQTAVNRCEFVWVDAKKGVRRPAFDHGKLAAALGTVAGLKRIAATNLPIDQLQFESDNRITFRAKKKWWQCDLNTYQLVERPAKQTAAPGYPVSTGPRKSARTGGVTDILFVNKTDAVVKLYWLDTNGRRKSYGQLKAGEQTSMSTYDGHVWLVTDLADKGLIVFIAGTSGLTAEINGKCENGRVYRRPRAASESKQRANAMSPNGQWQALIRDDNVALRNRKSGKTFPLSHDGTARQRYSSRFYWAPDSSKLVAIRTRPGADRKVTFVESSPKDQLQPKVHSFRYLKPGDEIDRDAPQLFDIASRRKIVVPDRLFSNPWSITNVRWSPDSKHFTFVYNQRGHQTLRIISVDATSGQPRIVVDEKSKTFIDYAGKQYAHYIDETGEIIWMSERDGWNHLYLIDAKTGRVKNQITSGKWVVRKVDNINDATRQIWLMAGGVYPAQDPYYLHLCRVNFDGSGLKILTKADGNHSIQWSPDRRYVIDRWSRVDHPPVTELRRASDGKLMCELERADATALLATGWKAPERFVSKGRNGTTDIFGVIFRPTHFDPKGKYPVIESIYAGPHGAFVPKSFRPYYKAQSLAELGFLVVKIDGMGTSQRSKAFHDVCWKNLGDSGFPDRILWIKAAAKKYLAMDLSRVGIYGGSAGGQSSLRALLAFGDFYHVAVADCGCHDNRMDKIWWNELWMGWPVGPHYAEQSNVRQAHRLRGKLLLIVAEMDRNVDPASTMQVVNALIKADKDFEMLVIPGAEHGAAETPYGTRRRREFFVRNLLGQTRAKPSNGRPRPFMRKLELNRQTDAHVRSCVGPEDPSDGMHTGCTHPTQQEPNAEPANSSLGGAECELLFP